MSLFDPNSPYLREVQRFKSGDFDVEDLHGGGRQNIFKDFE